MLGNQAIMNLMQIENQLELICMFFCRRIAGSADVLSVSPSSEQKDVSEMSWGIYSKV